MRLLRLLRFLRLPALLGLLRPRISFVSFAYSLTSSDALVAGGLWSGYSLVDDFSAMRDVKSIGWVVEMVVFLGALFLEPLGRGIDVHTPLNYEIMRYWRYLIVRILCELSI